MCLTYLINILYIISLTWNVAECFLLPVSLTLCLSFTVPAVHDRKGHLVYLMFTWNAVTELNSFVHLHCLYTSSLLFVPGCGFFFLCINLQYSRSLQGFVPTPLQHQEWFSVHPSGKFLWLNWIWNRPEASVSNPPSLIWQSFFTLLNFHQGFLRNTPVAVIFVTFPVCFQPNHCLILSCLLLRFLCTHSSVCCFVH